jgi:predicted HicB family RNase H-like nuclease
MLKPFETIDLFDVPRDAPKKIAFDAWLSKYKETCESSPFAGHQDKLTLQFEDAADFYEYYEEDCKAGHVPPQERISPSYFAKIVNEAVEIKREFIWQTNKV